MGIDKRGLRKIVRANRLFYWCVYPNEDDEDLLYLVIKSEDNRFRVHYRLGQSKDNPFIIVQGNEFKKVAGLEKGWVRFLVPDWQDEVITPSLVGEIIDWCLREEPVIRVDYQGKVIS